MCAAVTPLVLHIDVIVLNYAQEDLFPVSGRGRLIVEVSTNRSVFLNRRALASIITGRERFSWN